MSNPNELGQIKMVLFNYFATTLPVVCPNRLIAGKALRWLAFCLCALALSLSHPAWSAEWTISPYAHVGENYDDNFNLSRDPLRVWETTFSGGVIVDTRSDNWGVNFDGHYLGSRYIDNSDLDADEGFIDLLADYTTEYGIWELDGGLILDAPSSSEIEAGNEVFNRILRRDWHLGPAWTWEISEQNSLKLGYQYRDVTFDDRPFESSRFTDYFSHSAAATFTRQYTDATQILGIGTYIRTENDDERFETDQYILATGFNHEFSDSFETAFRIGGVILHSDFRLNPNDRTTRSSGTKSNIVGHLTFNKTFEYSKLTFGFDRFLESTVNGGLIILNRISTKYRHNLSDQLTGIVRLSASRSETIGSTISQVGRDNARAGAELNWEFLENWFLDGGYRYDWQERKRRASQDRNSVFLSLRYGGDPLVIIP